MDFERRRKTKITSYRLLHLHSINPSVQQHHDTLIPKTILVLLAAANKTPEVSTKKPFC